MSFYLCFDYLHDSSVIGLYCITIRCYKDDMNFKLIPINIRCDKDDMNFQLFHIPFPVHRTYNTMFVHSYDYDN